MATMQCKGCGRRIIQKGEKCPHCEEPIRPEISKKKDKITNSTLISCAACGKEISKNALSCPHCGEPIVLSSVNLSSSRESLIGFVGAALLMVGSFLPAINIPIRGSISYINNGRGDGMLIILIALLAFYYVYKKKKRPLLLSGGFSLIIIAYGFVNVLDKLSEVQKGAGSGFGQVLLDGIGVGSAFGVTAVGAILIIISSFMMKMENR